MAGSLHPRERHDRQKRSDVEARRGGIEADIAGERTLGERFSDPVGSVVKHLAPFEFTIEIHGCLSHASDRYYIVRRPRERERRESITR
jgi:hypothetical protein